MVSDHDDLAFADRLARAQAGDGMAFDALVRWLERPLVGYLRARGAWDAEGSANEVLVRVFGGIEGFRGDAGDFRAWVYRIARNLLIDERRRIDRRPDVIPTAPDAIPDDGDTTAAELDVETGSRVKALLDGLTPDQREVLLLRVVAGLSVEETAEVVGRRPGSVRALQHRALNALRREISPRT